MKDTQSNFVRHEPCPNCNSRDNLARYSDGHAYCFGCEYREPAVGETNEFKNEKINIEIKDHRKLGLSDLVELVKKYDMEQKTLFISSHYSVLKEFRKISKNNIATGASKSDIKRMIYFGNLPWYKIPFDAFQMPFYSKKVERYGLKKSDWVDRMQSKGLEVHYWTVDNYKDMNTYQFMTSFT